MAYVKFKPGTTTVVKLDELAPSGQDRYGNDEYKVNDGKDKMTPTSTLSSMIQETIQQNSIPVGGTIAITREGSGVDTRWSVSAGAGANPGTYKDQDPFTGGLGSNAPHPAVRGGGPMEPRTLQDLADEYKACLQAGFAIGMDIFQDDLTNEDVRSIGTTLYIQANREGIEFPK